MSLSDVTARIVEIESSFSAIAPPSLPTTRPAALQASTGTSFARALASAAAQTPTSPSTYGSPGPGIVAAAASQIGQSEQPPGSNDGPQIAVYRSAVAGAKTADPWCAYFASWAAAQAGAPLGDGGAGIGSVAGITDWAGRTGRLLPATATPQPGDLILFGNEHVGVVEAVNPDGSLETIEGNHANAVQQVHRLPGSGTGFVQLS